eukprot:TRINITY_DN801_c0_g1_i2.p1 TRINITY_DN801_c0_g1~~TRINITY_DN801_c0_g1_i2.p1  ORF type:complete len:255 (+),score=30.54 TRINITY_DN801_c0_g1_i2:946-1710(+)
MIAARNISDPESFYLMAGNLPWYLCNFRQSNSDNSIPYLNRRQLPKEHFDKLMWLSSEVLTRSLYVLEDNPVKNKSSMFQFYEELGLEFTKWGYPSTDIIHQYCHEDLISPLWRDISLKKWPSVIRLLKRASVVDVKWYERMDASWGRYVKLESPLKMSLKRKCPPEVIHAFCNVFGDEWDNCLSTFISFKGDAPLFLACRRADVSERMIVALLGPTKDRLAFMKDRNGETAKDLITKNHYIDEDLRKLLISKL